MKLNILLRENDSSVRLMYDGDVPKYGIIILFFMDDYSVRYLCMVG
jgi:hypothetical protein